MHILKLQYARVPRIGMLNHNFDPEARHLVVTLDVEGYDSPPANGFLTIYQALADLLPTLSHHRCCEEWENTPLYLNEQKGVSMKWVGEVADVAHLVEHVIVDLQCAITPMRRCSGITCGHKNPENRFDLFIECTDPQAGAFCAHLANYLVGAMFTKRRLSHRYNDIIDAARLVVEEPDACQSGDVIAKALEICPVRGRWAHTALTAFGLCNGESDHGSENTH
ncbi:MAG TPA: hypothetical protein VLB27_04280 [candidate division Zixibacteria bacterium]|nr:hypothetical protein [candidate division Zixibacteria bacterium]